MKKLRGAERLKVQFIHGLEGSPSGFKARFLAEHFDACTPAMDTSEFLDCVAQQARELENFQPDVLVGSSFGGAVAVELLQRGVWTGPTLLLAQASSKFQGDPRLPEGVPVVLVHGIRDDVIDPRGSRELARTGTPALVRLHVVDDTHGLGELVRSGRLADLVREVASLRP